MIVSVEAIVDNPVPPAIVRVSVRRDTLSEPLSPAIGRVEDTVAVDAAVI